MVHDFFSFWCTSFPLILVTSQYLWDLLYVYGTKRAAFKLHDKLLYNILRQPMSFFESTPIGRLLSRFSTDINIVDARLPYFLKIIAPYGFRVRLLLCKHAFVANICY